jgi:hypothetical protein
MNDANNIFKEIENALVDNVIIIKVAEKAQAFIRKRVYNQQYLEGSTGTSQYSTTPMPVPYGAFVKKFGKIFLRQKSKENNRAKFFNKGKNNFSFANAQDFKVFRSKSGKTMVIIPGGYKQWREINNKNSSPVDLTWSGRMLRNLGILRPPENGTAEIGFPSSSENLKAYYHNVAGAGKRKVTRKFMGITQPELDDLGDLAEKMIFQRLK